MIIYGIMSRSRNDVVFNTDTSFLLDSQLCSSSTQQEVCITHVNSIIIASEAKGVDKSEFVSLMQCLQVCADGALQLFQKGLREGDCVVPGVICFGESLRIVAVYFTPTTFPVLAYLSDLLSISTWEGRSKLSCWAIALSQFGLETIDLSLNMKGMQSRSPDKVKFRLCRQQFFKPVRNIETNDGAGIGIAESDVSSARVNLDVLMSVYSHLHSVVDADKSILFPVGVVSCPSTQNENGDDIRALLINFMKQHFRKWSNENNFNHLIFVIYPHLNSSDGWQSSDIRPPQELVEAYLMSLAQAVNVLNQAEIAHIDLRYEVNICDKTLIGLIFTLLYFTLLYLTTISSFHSDRPANILWRILPEEMGVDRLVSQSSSTIPLKGNIGSDRIGASVEIQIIDFEDAVPFGWLIKHAANYRRHPSYPDFGPTSVVTIGAESSSSSQVTRDVAVLVAGQPHNDFFLRAITKWLRGT